VARYRIMSRSQAEHAGENGPRCLATAAPCRSCVILSSLSARDTVTSRIVRAPIAGMICLPSRSRYAWAVPGERSPASTAALISANHRSPSAATFVAPVIYAARWVCWPTLPCRRPGRRRRGRPGTRGRGPVGYPIRPRCPRQTLDPCMRSGCPIAPSSMRCTPPPWWPFANRVVNALDARVATPPQLDRIATLLLIRGYDL
jgi:hypothetical protein